MRLLKYNDNGTLVVTSDFTNNIIPYAILSHTWGADTEEVTFDDITNGTGTGKTGYDKIHFCGQQARRDGLHHFWVDTCCIDKSNKAELSHSIRSMFRWYRNATRCYVHLADVSVSSFGDPCETNSLSWQSSFRQSRWFHRGWTLQELLAPSTVEFFSNEKGKLGDRETLKLQIHQITDIPLAVLEGYPLHHFSVEERLRWKAHRETKREEDGAYSLLGIFGVDLAPLYNEGAANAFRRLKDEIDKQERCVRDLCGTDPRDDKKRIEDMKGGLLENSYRWILDHSGFHQWQDYLQHRLLWIKGDPGKGKTMLLCGIINELQNNAGSKTLVCYFFCQATDSRINNATAVLRGLLFMLFNQKPSLIQHVRKRYDHAGRSVFEDANAWISLTEIFTNVLEDPHLEPTYLIIDALDECVATDLPKLLDFIAQQSSVSCRVKWLVSSRNWPDIEERLQRASGNIRLSLELNAESVSTSVRHFIEQKVSQLAQQKQYDEQTRKAVIQHLVLNADNTFLWVALVCQNLEGTARRNVLKKLSLFPPGLESLYERMMQRITKSDDAELCRQILAMTAVVYQPLSMLELVVLVEPLKEIDGDTELAEIISSCGSFLTLRNETVYFVHQSAKDFLLTRAVQTVFPDGKDIVHGIIFAHSLDIMSQTLKRDMYHLKWLGCHIDDVGSPDPDPLASSRYACVYWVDHLCESFLQPPTGGPYEVWRSSLVIDFLRKYYLYWLEGLSLCRSVPKGIVSMSKLQSLVKGTESVPLTHLVHDAQRFVMYHQGAIQHTPLQAYASALLFSPAKSVIRELFQHEEPKYIHIVPVMRKEWSACLQTLEAHTGSVSSVVFSHDSTRLASASWDFTVKIWDASSSACLQTLKGHTGYVNSIVFSHDSTRLASASFDRTIKIWDTSSGACLQTFKGYTGSVSSVVFPHDSTRLASALWDFTVKIWDANSNACLQTLEGHTGYVSSVVFSHDLTRLASASYDHTVKIWNTSSGACLQTLDDHTGSVSSVVFSHDSTRLASASYDHTVKIWNASSGACLQTLDDHTDSVNSVVFSNDSTRLASASYNRTVKVWDASSGACLQTFEGHTSWVNSAVYSHDLTRLASASNDSTVKIWDISSDACLQMPEGHTSWVRSVVFSHDSTRLASASNNNTAKIWDVRSGACLQTLDDHTGSISSIVFSHDSTRLATASHDHIVKIWDGSSSVCLQTLKGHTSWVNSAVFSHDSTRLASASWDDTVKIWNTSSGKCLQTLDDLTGSVSSVVFSHDSTRLASVSNNSTVKIWDASSGACLQTFDVRREVRDLAFDSTGLCLETEIGTIDISASATICNTDSINTQRPRYVSLGCSADRTWISLGGQNLLWVPSEYRSSCSASSMNVAGIGTGSGRVWICTTTDNIKKSVSDDKQCEPNLNIRAYLL